VRALQVWLPSLRQSLGHALLRRDAQWAFEAWKGEDTVFLLPGLRTPERWVQWPNRVGWRVLALGAEHLDRLDVYHVGENGHAWGVASADRFPSCQVAGLLRQFLAINVTTLRLCAPGAPCSLYVPCVRRGRIKRRQGKIGYERKTWRIAGHPLPVKILQKRTRTVEFGWPPKDLDLHSLHPDAEAHEAWRSEPGRRRVARVWFSWPAPFDKLFTPAAGLDEFQTLAKMRKIAQESQTNGRGALRQALEASSQYMSEGWSTVSATKFWPAYLAAHAAVAPGEPMRPFWAEFGITAKDMQGALAADALRRPVRVQRVWGGLGLLWALFVERLENDGGLNFCDRCRMLVGGRRRFCGPTDDLQCYRKRRAADRKKERRIP
jgi:hypothetical protein